MSLLIFWVVYSIICLFAYCFFGFLVGVLVGVLVGLLLGVLVLVGSGVGVLIGINVCVKVGVFVQLLSKNRHTPLLLDLAVDMVSSELPPTEEQLRII